MNEVERESLRKNLLNKAKAEKLSALEEKTYYPSQEIISQEIISQVWFVVSVIQQILVLATPPIVPILLPWDSYRRGVKKD